MRRIDAAAVTLAAAGIAGTAAVVMAAYRAHTIEQRSVEVIDAVLDCAFFAEEGDTCQVEERQLTTAGPPRS
jgi:hypothetical protein